MDIESPADTNVSQIMAKREKLVAVFRILFGPWNVNDARRRVFVTAPDAITKW
jgi:hypothetical protein